MFPKISGNNRNFSVFVNDSLYLENNMFLRFLIIKFALETMGNSEGGFVYFVS